MALIVGILLADQFPILWDFPLITIVVLMAAIILAAFVRQRNVQLVQIVSGTLSLSLITYLGGFLLIQNNQRSLSDHLTHFDARVQAFSGTVVSDNFEREKYQRYILQINQVLIASKVESATGLLYLYVKKDSSQSIISYGTQLRVKGAFYEIDQPTNPDQFNYRKYLARKNVFAQAFVTSADVQPIGHHPPNLILNHALRVRKSSSEMITDFIPGSHESAVLNALLLGVKDFLDNDIKKAYSAAGAMHVLAVSGLHVGIVYLLITLVFGQMRKSNWGRVAFLVVCLTTIWSFALITGFSASVMRAATMFSVIAVGEGLKRKGNIYNSLGIAAFILLIYNPFFVFDVGFQLSFIAVFGIVTFQPPIYALWQPTNQLLDYLWAIISVSIAAQLVTFPLSVYYFNQLPTYFLISNLIVIPAAMVMLTTGLFMLVIGSISALGGKTVGFLLGGFVELVNWLIMQIQSLPASTVDWIYLSALSVLLIYVLMIYSFFGLRYQRFDLFALSLACLMLLFVNFHYEDYQHLNQKRIVVYYDKEQLVIDLINGKDANVLTTGTVEYVNEMASFSIDPHRLSNGLQNIDQSSISIINDSIMNGGMYFKVWEGQKILVVIPQSSGTFDQMVDIDILVVQSYQPQIVDSVHAKHLLLSQMDWRDRLNMIRHLDQQKIEYFDMFERGYFELDLSR